MPSLCVVINFYVLKYVLAHGFTIHNWLVLNRFNLHGVKEAFNAGVVPAVAFAAHALYQAMLRNQMLVVVRAVLAASVAVNNYSFRLATAPQCHLQSVTY